MYRNCLLIISLLSSIVVTAVAQSGNPADLSSYPLCAQTCFNETYPPCTTTECACGATFRSGAAACEAVSCSHADYNTTQTLALQLCGPFYTANSTLSSAVSAAIASATSVAVAAVSGKNLSDPASFPQCAQNCFSQIGYFDCGSLANQSCICNGTGPFSSNVGACEVANCSVADFEITVDLADAYCNSLGGYVGPNTTTQTPTPKTTPSATIVPFEGAAASVARTGFYGFCMAIVGLVGFVGLLL